MTVLFPDSSSLELEPYVLPFGKMMLAYGRAYETIVAFAMLECATEAEARNKVRSPKDLPQNMRHLFRAKIEESAFVRMDEHVKQFSKVAAERHHLIHGEWWFDPDEGGCLAVL